MDYSALREKVYASFLELVTEDGINASGKDEIYGCIFGRDSAITILKLLKVASSRSAKQYYDTSELYAVCRKTLLTLVSLQGKEHVLESGEQPGKFIHEYRTTRFEHLLGLEKPWFVYPDGILRNYDSLDATPLALIAIYRYWQQTRDDEFLLSVLSSVERGLNWIITYADMDKDFLVEYELSSERTHGGLPVQSWTDSKESLLKADGLFPHYPIAPVEVQGYTWLALKLWADFYAHDQTHAHTSAFAKKLSQQAMEMKERFNRLFLFKSEGLWFPSQALDGYKNQIQTITGNPLLLLYATYTQGGAKESILFDEYRDDLVKRAFLPDLFSENGGVRTMSTTSPTFDATKNSYHNGSFWPKLNGMGHEGLSLWGYVDKAEMLKDATLRPLFYFGSPIELYILSDENLYDEFSGPTGQKSCRNQAWSAATALDLLTLN